MYDLIIQNGCILDGSGSSAFTADVAVKDGKIVKIGSQLSGSVSSIDAAGLAVAPGFIDSHSHADRNVLSHPDLVEKVEQGITLSMSGMCGESATPLSVTDKPESFGNEFELRKDPVKFFSYMRQFALGSGLAFFVGHGTLRKSVMGMENRAPTTEELEKMKKTLRLCLVNGARGLSFGLYYVPGIFASIKECVELAKVVAEYGGVVSAHIRNESDELAKSVSEFLSIIKLADVRGVLSHHKACGSSENWGKVHHTLHMIDEANASGQDVYCDMYPYNATCTSLSATFLPSEEQKRGSEVLVKLLDDPNYRSQIRPWIEEKYGKSGFDWVQVNQCDYNRSYSGRTVSDIAKERSEDEIETIFALMRDSNLTCTACYFTIWENDLQTVLRHPRCMICTDAGVCKTPDGVYHPRLRGSFPRALGRYVREKQIVSLPEMIRKMTAMPAHVYGLSGKGLLRENMDADICIFNPDTISDKCWFGDCHKRNEGLSYVLISGKIIAENGVYNGIRMAKAIL